MDAGAESDASEWPGNMAALNRQFDGAAPETAIAWAAERYGNTLCLASSMTDLVLPHLVSTVLPGVTVFFLDTGFHFPETLDLRARAEALLPITVVDIRPEPILDAETPTFETDPDGCCVHRKVLPLRRALSGYAAWAVGNRRSDSTVRRQTPYIAWDSTHGLIKLSPLAGMSDADVTAYLERHRLPRHAFAQSDGSTSIGCAPCTLLPAPDRPVVRDEVRWPGLTKTECGIHR